MKKGKKFILVIYGPSCGGKSSVIDLLISKHENLFRVSQDKIKWLISRYDKNKHTEIVYSFLVNLAKDAVSKKFSLVVEGGNVAKNKVKDFRLLAKKNKMDFFELNREAPFDTAKERFKERVKGAKLKGWRVSNKSLKRFKELYNLHEEKKNKKTPTFDSSVLTTEKIVKEIENIIFN